MNEFIQIKLEGFLHDSATVGIYDEINSLKKFVDFKKYMNDEIVLFYDNIKLMGSFSFFFYGIKNGDKISLLTTSKKNQFKSRERQNYQKNNLYHIQTINKVMIERLDWAIKLSMSNLNDSNPQIYKELFNRYKYPKNAAILVNEMAKKSDFLRSKVENSGFFYRKVVQQFNEAVELKSMIDFPQEPTKLPPAASHPSDEILPLCFNIES